MTSIAVAAPRFSFSPRVTLGERLSRLFLGSPSISYAFRDMRLRKANAVRRAAAGETAREVPVFAVDRREWKGAERLPRIWLSEPAFDDAAERAGGRVFIEAYPSDPDPQGWHAYGLAEKYFSEGLGYAPGTPPSGDAAAAYRARRLRRDCFRAAEVLLLHALRAGNPAARRRLAAIYRYDLCEGAYWSGLREKRARHRKPIDPRRRALRLLEQAAAAGDAESALGLGEMLWEGCGCAADAERAFGRFAEAFEGAESDFVRGIAALRLARCFEEGRGARHSFAAAEERYGQAADLLQRAFDGGEWHCKRQLVEARLGMARMAQELAGCY